MVIPPGPWFVVLPDVQAARSIADRLRSETPAGVGLQEIRHPSGRPFVVGVWADAVVAQGRDSVVVAIGEFSQGATYCERAAERGDVAVLDLLHPEGSVHLLASAGGKVRVQGTASGLRRVFHTEIQQHARAGLGVVVAADRADVLAALVGAEPDPAALALQLLSLNPPWPLSWRSVWTGVTAVEPGHCVMLESGQHYRWWNPPEPVLSLADAGAALREALDTAVRIRRTGAPVACDLSGLDSSSLFGLAVRAGGPVTALTYQADDPIDDDLPFAQYLVETLRATATSPVSHEVLATPTPFAGLLDDPGWFDEPTWVSTWRARISTANAAAAGATLRYSGYGGDELLMSPVAWLADIARQHPVRAARLARRLQAKYKLSAKALASLVADRTTYGEWLATSLRTGTVRPSDGALGDWQALNWGLPVELPDWITPDGEELIRRAIADQAGRAEPLSAARGMHVTLEFAHVGAMPGRHIAQLGAAQDVPVALPFFDDRVMEACLAVRPEEAIDPRRYKPQLVTAMDGVLPARTLARTSKADASMTVDLGWRTHRSDLIDLFDNSRLAKLGLIDATAARRICEGPFNLTSCGPVQQALEVETWLHAVSDRTTTTGGSR